MGSAARRRRFLTVDEYFAIEEMSDTKHEYLDGEVLAMAGASLRHNTIAANLLGALRNALRGTPCRALGSDQRLATPDDLYTYPDVAVYCGRIALVGGRPDTATNPTVLIEILSDSTRAYDCGDKLAFYQAIPSVTDLLLVEQDRVEVTHWTRTSGGWQATAVEAACRLTGCPVELAIAEIYEGVDQASAR